MTPNLTALEKKGALLVRPMPLTTMTVIDSPEDYADADMLLTRVIHAREAWKRETAEVRETAKAAHDAAEALFKKIDGPLKQKELALKGSMREFKLAEARQIAEAEAAKRAEADRLEAERVAAELKAKLASTPQQKAAATRTLNTIAREAEVVESMPAEAPVKVAGSQARMRKTWALVDPKAAMKAQLAGVIPEVFTLHSPTVTAAVREHGLDEVGQWPGFALVDDVVIAGSRR